MDQSVMFENVVSGWGRLTPSGSLGALVGATPANAVEIKLKRRTNRITGIHLSQPDVWTLTCNGCSWLEEIIGPTVNDATRSRSEAEVEATGTPGENINVAEVFAGCPRTPRSTTSAGCGSILVL
jgi:hypothetical protein